MSDLIHYLLQIPYFGELDAQTIQQVARQMLRRSFAPDEVIFFESEPASGLWMVESGRVKIFKLNPDGEEHILHLLGPGNTFNDIAALDGGINPANAAALSHSVVWLLPREVLNTLILDHPALARKIIQLLAGRVRSLVQQIEDLALHSVTIRLARFLLKQAEDPALSGPGVTRAAIAAHLATKPETVSRALRTLEETGAIRFDRHRIIIMQENVLRAIAAL